MVDAPPSTPRRDLIDPEEVEAAWRLLKRVAWRLDIIAREEGWTTPFGPVRYLILALLESATAYGLSARRLARSLAVSPSTLAHHLNVLERADLVHRVPWTVHDRRKVAVRLTDTGRYALRRFTGPAPGPHPSPPGRSPLFP